MCGCGSAASTKGIAQLTPTMTATPSPPAVPIVTAAALWGAKNIRAITFPLADGKPLIPTDVAPDGSIIVGYTMNLSSYDREIWVYTVANGAMTHLARVTYADQMATLTGHLQPLAAPGPGVALFDPTTDGRFVTWQHEGNTDEVRTTVYDRQTQQLTTLPYVSVTNYSGNLQHGNFITVAGTEEQLSVHNLASGTNTDIAAVGDLDVLFSWPYIVYQAKSDRQWHIYSITTKQDTIGNDAVQQSFTQISVNGLNPVIAGNTLFWRQIESAPNQLEAIDNFTALTATVRLAATLPDTVHVLTRGSVGIGIGNARILAWYNVDGIYAWDTSHQQLVQTTDAVTGTGVPLFLHGDSFLYQISNDGWQLVNTNQLP